MASASGGSGSTLAQAFCREESGAGCDPAPAYARLALAEDKLARLLHRQGGLLQLPLFSKAADLNSFCCIPSSSTLSQTHASPRPHLQQAHHGRPLRHLNSQLLQRGLLPPCKAQKQQHTASVRLVQRHVSTPHGAGSIPRHSGEQRACKGPPACLCAAHALGLARARSCTESRPRAACCPIAQTSTAGAPTHP